MRVDDKVAMVTGAGSGIGRAAAEMLARHGAKVGALSHTESEVQEAAEQIRKDGGEAIALAADVRDPEAMKRSTEQLVQKYGRLDIVLANAGVNGVWTPLEELEPEEWERTLKINLTGTFLTVKYALPYLKKQGGSVIVTSSINGNRVFSNTGATAYSCSKAGQVAFTKMVALELAKDKIRVNVICPGAIESQINENTERRDLEHVRPDVEFPEGKVPLTEGKPGKAEQVAQLVLFLASEASSHISGTEIYIDGAESLLQG